MPTIAENMSWGTYAWSQSGDEWSGDWGTADRQWHSTILPRVHQYLPAQSILEIAPGFGRWSAFLIERAERYVGIDLNPQCIDACKKRFSTKANAQFVTNDGKSLDAVPDKSIDFAFSFDSLVHVELDVLSAYFTELAKKLSPNGIAFLHHSNLGEYAGAALNLSKRLDKIGSSSLPGKLLRRLQISDWDRWRAPSVTAVNAAEAAKKAGLACISQEIVPWGPRNRRMIDCMTTVTPQRSRWARANIRVRNPDFMKEARSAQCTAVLYR